MLMRNFFLLPLIALASFANADRTADRTFAYERKAAHEQRIPDASQGEIAHNIAEDIVALHRGRKMQPTGTQPVTQKDTWSWSNPKSWLKIFSTSTSQATDKQKNQQPVEMTAVPTSVDSEPVVTAAASIVEATAQTATATTIPVTAIHQTSAQHIVSTPLSSVQSPATQSKPHAIEAPAPLVLVAHGADAQVTTEFVPAQASIPAMEIATEYIPATTAYKAEEIQLPSTFVEVEQPKIIAPNVMVADTAQADISTEFVPATVVMDSVPVEAELISAAVPQQQGQTPADENAKEQVPHTTVQQVDTVTLADTTDAQITTEFVPARADIPTVPVAADCIPVAQDIPEDVRSDEKIQLHEMWNAHEVHEINRKSIAAIIAAERATRREYNYQQLPNNVLAVEQDACSITALDADIQDAALEQVATPEQSTGLHYYWSLYKQAWQEQQGATAAKTALGVGLTALAVYAAYKGGKWLYNYYYAAPKAIKKDRKSNKARKQIRKKLKLY